MDEPAAPGTPAISSMVSSCNNRDNVSPAAPTSGSGSDSPRTLSSILEAQLQNHCATLNRHRVINRHRPTATTGTTTTCSSTTTTSSSTTTTSASTASGGHGSSTSTKLRTITSTGSSIRGATNSNTGKRRVNIGRRNKIDAAFWQAGNINSQLIHLGVKPKKRCIVSERRNLETGKRKTKTKHREHKSRKPSSTKQNIGVSTQIPGAREGSGLPDFTSIIQETELITKTLEDMLEELQEEYTQPKPKSWSQRMDDLDEDWTECRPRLLKETIASMAIPIDMICLQCKSNKATVQCTECPFVLQCTVCDIFNHGRQPFHIRQGWVRGFFEPLPSGKTVEIDPDCMSLKLTNFTQYLPMVMPDLCRSCKSSSDLCMVPADRTYIVVTLKGRFEVHGQKVMCNDCHVVDKSHEIEDLVHSGYWPGSIKKINHVFTTELLSWVDIMLKSMPGTSIGAMAQALQAFGPQDTPINKTVLSRVLQEYRYIQRAVLLREGFDAMECPPCTKYQHSSHVDGNFKLYRYRKVPRGSRLPVNQGVFIVENDMVQEHLDDVYSKDEMSDNTCGRSNWKAAKAKGTAKAKQDETGLAVAGCRHSLAQKAVNMFRGEMYGYPHFLHVHFMLPAEVKYIWQDVICKYWPWAVKQQKSPNFVSAVQEMKPALSVMHAKAHAWDCQIIWGGRYQEGAGTGTGEEMEQCFSYLSRLNSTTKNMSAAGREDVITEHVFFWNARKIATMIAQLCKRFKRVQEARESTATQLETFWASSGNGHNISVIEDWHTEVVNLATGSQENNIDHVNADVVAFFKTVQQLIEIGSLTKYTSTSSNGLSHLTGSSLLFSEASQYASDEKSLKEKKRRLLKLLKIKFPDASEEELFSKGKCASADAILTRRLQPEIEMVSNGIRRRKVTINREADSSKQRRKLRAKNAGEKKKLGSLLMKHAEISQLSSTPADQCTPEDAINGKFSWKSGSNGDVPLDVKKEGVDIYMLKQRLDEERDILKLDMCNFLRYYMDVKEGLETSIKQSEVNVIKGMLETKKKGLAFTNTQLSTASFMFKKALLNEWDDFGMQSIINSLQTNEEEEDHESENDMEAEDDILSDVEDELAIQSDAADDHD